MPNSLEDVYLMGHEQVVICHDPEAGYRGILAVHSTVLGPAVGGTRLWPYATIDDALRDALRLSRGMTYKNAAAGLAMGGGKAVIIANGATVDRERIFLAHGRFVDSLGGRFITAEDVGTTPADFAIASRVTPHVAGYDGRGGDPSPWTARGVFSGILACSRHRWGTSVLDGRTVAIQGCGNVGSHLARALAEAGARLILTDVTTGRAEELARELRARVVMPDEIYSAEADIFAPCALGAVLNARTIPRLRATIVAGAANNQLANDDDAESLTARGMLYAPDFVINAGGVINGSVVLLGVTEESMIRQVDAIGDTLTTIFAYAERHGVTTARAADARAETALAAGRARRRG